VGRFAPTARAACGDDTGEPTVLFTFEPAPNAFEIAGTAPLQVSASWVPGAVLPAGSTANLNWGDGSASTPFTLEPCGDGETVNWPPQTHAHTYAAAGMYTLVWNVNVVQESFSFPIAIVSVQPAQVPTPAPTAPSVPTATPLPASTTAASATATAPPAASPVAAGTIPVATATQVSPTPTPPTATPPGIGPTATTAAAAVAVAPSPPGSPAAANLAERDLPEALRAMPRLDDISVNGNTIATNLALAGVTLWVLFSSVLLNQVLQDNRAEIDQHTARLTRRLRGRAGSAGRTISGIGRRLALLFVLLLTGVIYGFLNPGFGFNRPSAVLFLSVILGVGAVTWVCSGLEALVTRRTFGVAAAVRPYPASLAVAALSVGVSRVIGLQPGVIYGFVASCAVTGPGLIDERRQGRVTIVPVATAVFLAVVSLLAMEPLRANASVASSLPGQVAIGAGIIVFVGGIEGVAFNMIPLKVTDGGKLFLWHRTVWAATSLVAAFLFWHVLLNRNSQYFGALRQAKSLAVLAIFVVYTSLSIGLWAYFRWRPPKARADAEAE
jgi:hypothetical protein